MNKKQWYVLAFVSLVFLFIFVNLDLNHGAWSNSMDVCDYMDDMLYEMYNSGEITIEEYSEMIANQEFGEFETYCLIRGEIYAPFIYLSFLLMFVFFIMALLERK